MLEDSTQLLMLKESISPPVLEDGTQLLMHEESISPPVLEDGTQLLMREESISPPVLEDTTQLLMREESISPPVLEDGTQLPMHGDSISVSPSYGLTSFYSNTSPILSSNSTAISKSSSPTTSPYGLTLHHSSTSVTSNYRKPITIGARVKRGPDWSYWTHGNQDGGVGKLGTVVRRSTKRGYDFVVKWDGKVTQYDYRWGSQNKYELELVS